jgi:hypothetical protein
MKYKYWGCSALTTIEIPSNVTAIKLGAFSETGLTSIDIPASVTTIGHDAFLNCSSLASVTVRATTPPQLAQYAFYGNASGRKIYVPGEVLNVYKNAEGWSDYADDIQPIGAVPYIDADGNMAYRSGCVEVTSDLTEFNDNTWYVVNSDVSMNGKLDVIGEANIILCDGATLNLNDLEEGSGYNQITIYGQSGGSGTLKSDYDIVLFNTSLIINGGTITVDKIIGHQEITIRRGNVTANSNDDGYAISSGKIIISGGSVTATALSNGNAIYSYFDNVVINGGTVMTEGTVNGTVTIAEQMIDCTSGTKRVITESIDGNMATALNTFFGNGASVNASFKRTFTKDVASTICLPFPMTSIPSGKVYQFVGVEYDNTEGWVATMSDATPDNKVTSTTANTPYLFKPGADGEVTFTGTIASVPASITAGSTTSTDNDWTFNGTYSRLTYSGDLTGQHIFGFAANKNDATGVKAGEFVKAIDGAYFPAFRAYLEYTGSEESLLKARGTRSGETAVIPEYITVRLIGKNGEIDGIGEIRLSTDEVTFDSNAWYDLNGRRLAEKPTTKGIYINGGHKVVIK